MNIKRSDVESGRKIIFLNHHHSQVYEPHVGKGPTSPNHVKPWPGTLHKQNVD